MPHGYLLLRTPTPKKLVAQSAKKNRYLLPYRFPGIGIGGLRYLALAGWPSRICPAGGFKSKAILFMNLFDNLGLDREENTEFFNMVDALVKLEQAGRRLLKRIENTPQQVKAGGNPRKLRRSIRAGLERHKRNAAVWQQDLQLFLNQPYLAVTGEERERIFSQALALLRDAGGRLTTEQEQLAGKLAELKKLKRPRRNPMLIKAAIFVAPLVLVLVLLYLFQVQIFK